VDTRKIAPTTDGRQQFPYSATLISLPSQRYDRREAHASDALQLLERLREANVNGECPSTAQLQREGLFGLRPVNRIGDLRKGKNLSAYFDIQRIKCPHGVYRWKLHEPPRPLSKQEWRTQRRGGDQFPLPELPSEDWSGRPRMTGLPLFDLAVRS